MQWDLFCRVVDNFGDIGVCWRLAADLGARGQSVRLWIDDPTALAWMAPSGASGVDVLPWAADTPVPPPGDMVVEAFGCDPPPAFVARMARSKRPPLWINLEYLSAEAFVSRSHGLRSPQLSGPGRGLDKWFFYPGFEPGTGGLIREPGLMEERRRFDGLAWLQARGMAPRPGERVTSLFCYASAPVGALLQALAAAPTLLLVTPGAASQALQVALAYHSAPPTLRCVALPWLSQPDYDHLLWACDLNFVRGEDSFVRAQWAARPLVWHIYPQAEDAHRLKLEAFLHIYCRDLPAAPAVAAAAMFRAWNLGAGIGDAWRDFRKHHGALCAHAGRWASDLAQAKDLTAALVEFCELRLQ